MKIKPWMPIAFFKVDGRSMEPTMRGGDIVFATRIWQKKTSALRGGFLVAAHHQTLGYICKRIARIEGEAVWLEGDGPLSSSSEEMGAFRVEDIQFRIRWIIPLKGDAWGHRPHS